ncbi:phospholipid scramblase 1-like [Babylonia areolata]|uniref:phospholipid scramblase 1-like n=1 Tax=Babylonia areolata TaxID=304850 RepID=UPI003FD1A138
MSAGVVISQPGQKGGMDGTQQPGMGFSSGLQSGFSQPQPMMMQPATISSIAPMAVPAGLPPGLAYLAGLDEVRIHQQMDIVEVFAGWERNNRYTLCNNQEQQFMMAKEKTDCLTRQCCGPARPFTMDIMDNQGMQLIQLHRPLRCQASCLCCCWLQEMEIQSPPGVPIGHIKQMWTCWTPRYKVYNNQDQCVFTIVGDCCYCKCTDVIFRIFDGDSENSEEAQVRKHFGGAREICMQANDFTLHMPANMDILKKALLFGATFLIDFNYFEHPKN